MWHLLESKERCCERASAEQIRSVDKEKALSGAERFPFIGGDELSLTLSNHVHRHMAHCDWK